jgi:hypothetical protein
MWLTLRVTFLCSVLILNLSLSDLLHSIQAELPLPGSVPFFLSLIIIITIVVLVF